MTDADTRRSLLPLDALQRFLWERGLLPGDAPIQAREIGSGHSNPTYLVTQGEIELVVRRPPPPPLPPSAHDVLREARVIAAVAGRVPVPRVLAVCRDVSVLGVPFYVMERVHGTVITQEVPAALEAPAERRRIAEELIDALVAIHAVDWRACGLEDFGRPSGYLGRQLRRISELWLGNRTRELPEIERVGEWLAANMPDAGEPTIVHGDFRLGNAMFADEPPARVVAMFDWEMATIGDPLADVGYHAMFWVQPDDPPLRMFELSQATRSGGFPSREEVVARYEERSGRPARDVRWYEVLALWKLAVIMEGNVKRIRAGTLVDPYLQGFAEGVVELADRAAHVAGLPGASRSA